MAARRTLTLEIPADRVIRLPVDIPIGRVVMTIAAAPAEPASGAEPEERAPQRGEGLYEGLFSVDDSFDDPLPPELAGFFNGAGDHAGPAE